MLIHICSFCEKISINRIASDDFTEVIIEVFEQSKNLYEDLNARLTTEDFQLLSENDRQELYPQIFGK